MTLRICVPADRSDGDDTCAFIVELTPEALSILRRDCRNFEQFEKEDMDLLWIGHFADGGVRLIEGFDDLWDLSECCEQTPPAGPFPLPEGFEIPDYAAVPTEGIRVRNGDDLVCWQYETRPGGPFYTSGDIELSLIESFLSPVPA